MMLGLPGETICGFARARSCSPGCCLRRIAKGYRFMRARALLIVVLAALGSLAGVCSVFLLRPRSWAACDVKLLPQVKSNPVDPQVHNPYEETDSPQFFQGPERAFAQPDLVRATLHKMQPSLPNPSDAELISISSRLKLESVGEHRFRASYQDP